jgi:hypothetical protein
LDYEYRGEWLSAHAQCKKVVSCCPKSPWKILALCIKFNYWGEEGVTQIILRNLRSNKGYVAIMARKKVREGLIDGQRKWAAQREVFIFYHLVTFCEDEMLPIPLLYVNNFQTTFV